MKTFFFPVLFNSGFFLLYGTGRSKGMATYAIFFCFKDNKHYWDIAHNDDDDDVGDRNLSWFCFFLQKC